MKVNCGFDLFEVLDRPLDGFLGALGILDFIRGIALEQAPEVVPVVEARELRLRPLLLEHPEDGREDAARTHGDRRDVELVRLPVVRGDPVLLRARPHDHRGPVRAAAGRHHAAGVQGRRALLHERVQDRRFRLADPVGAQPVDSDDHDMVDPRDLGRRRQSAHDSSENGQGQKENGPRTTTSHRSSSTCGWLLGVPIMDHRRPAGNDAESPHHSPTSRSLGRAGSGSIFLGGVALATVLSVVLDSVLGSW